MSSIFRGRTISTLIRKAWKHTIWLSKKRVNKQMKRTNSLLLSLDVLLNRGGQLKGVFFTVFYWHFWTLITGCSIEIWLYWQGRQIFSQTFWRQSTVWLFSWISHGQAVKKSYNFVLCWFAFVEAVNLRDWMNSQIVFKMSGKRVASLVLFVD